MRKAVSSVSSSATSPSGRERSMPCSLSQNTVPEAAPHSRRTAPAVVTVVPH